MRIGVLDTWLAGRYVPFWEAYLSSLGADIIRPSNNSLLDVPFPDHIRQVLSEAFELKNKQLDYIVLPDTQLGITLDGVSAPPWLTSLEAVLQQHIPGLPPILVVPAELSKQTAGLAAKLGQSLFRNPMQARRALERTKSLLTPTLTPTKPLGTALVGLVAQPMLLEPRFTERLEALLVEHRIGIFKPDKSPEQLREEGQALGLKLVLPTDLETAGMHHYFVRLGKVKALIHWNDPDYLPLPAALAKYIRKHPPTPKPWLSLSTPANWPELVHTLASQIS
jgi:hypothetical protein